jgi:ATP-dependent Clp protease ATP-binding subunit ClpA
VVGSEHVLRNAAEPAAERGHGLVGTEHVLLALTRLSDDSLAHRLLDDLGVTESVRTRVEAAIGEV